MINVESTEKVWNKDLPSIPVIRLDFSMLISNKGPETLEKEFIRGLKSIGKSYGIIEILIRLMLSKASPKNLLHH